MPNRTGWTTRFRFRSVIRAAPRVSRSEGLWCNQTSAVVELCLTRAAKRAEALTNSENAARDAEKAPKHGCGTVSGLGRQPLRLATERRPDTQVRRNIEAIRGSLPSTNGRGVQFEALEWLPERYIAREKIALAPQ